MTEALPTEPDTPEWVPVDYGTFVGQVHRSELLMYGRAVPTVAERDAREAEHRAFHAHEVAAHAATVPFVAAVDALAAAGGVAGAVLAVHARAEHGDCPACHDTYTSSWPCETVRVVARACGVTVPDDVVLEEPAPVVPDPDNPRWPYPAGPWSLADLFPQSFVKLDPIVFTGTTTKETPTP